MYVGGISKMMLVMGSLLNCCLTVALGYFLLDDSKVNSFLGPLVVIGIMGYNIGGFLIGIYAVSSDTILHCFCIDLELN
jgi:hypothetical protein